MKRTSIVFFITFLFLIILSACKENQYMDWKLMNDKWYSIHQHDSGFVTTSSGLSYKIIYPGWYLDRKPNSSDVVTVSGKGSLIDGSIFELDDSTSYLLSSSIVTPAWREMMPKLYGGAHVIFYAPSKIGYDTISSNPAYPPYSVLIYDITLLDSHPNN